MKTIEQKGITPSFGNSFGHGWETMSKYFLILLLVVIVLGLISAPAGIANFNPGDHHGNWGDHWDWNRQFDHFFSPAFAVFGIVAFVIGIIALAYSLLIKPVFEYGGDLMFVHAVRDVRPDFETLIKGFKENYLHIVLANVLRTALVMLGIVFLIIPGIIVACRTAFVSYLVMDKKMDPIVAIEESWRMTKGIGWTIFFMGIASVFLFIVGILFLIVGVFPVIVWTKSAFASLYENVLITRNGGAELE